MALRSPTTGPQTLLSAKLKKYTVIVHTDRGTLTYLGVTAFQAGEHYLRIGDVETEETVLIPRERIKMITSEPEDG